MKEVFKYILIFSMLLIIFFSLHFLIALLPSSLTYENVVKSSNILLKEGNRYKFFDIYNVTNNNYTDSIMINEAYSYDSNDPIYSFLSVRKNYNKDITKIELPDKNGELISITNTEEYDPVGELKDFLDGTITTSIEYARYWHGYLIFLRPLLIFFDISGIRFLAFLLFLVLFIALVILLNKRFGTIYSLIFAFAFIFLDYFFVSYSLECSPVFIITMIASIYLLLRIDKIHNLGIFFFVIGCITNFTEFLTIPVLSFGIPMTIYLLYLQKKKDYNLKDTLLLIFKNLFIWLIGYIITQFSKWIIFDIMYNKNLISSALSQVLYRTSSANPYSKNSIWITIISLTFQVTISLGFFLLILIAIFRVHYINNDIVIKINKEKFKALLPFIIMALLPFFWYIALSNHTIYHTFVVYRLMLLFFINISVCFLKLIEFVKKKK